MKVALFQEVCQLGLVTFEVKLPLLCCHILYNCAISTLVLENTGENSTFVHSAVAIANHYNFRFLHSTRYPSRWVGTGRLEWEVYLTRLHMTSTGNWTPDFLILSPVPYPLGHMRPYLFPQILFLILSHVSVEWSCCEDFSSSVGQQIVDDPHYKFLEIPSLVQGNTYYVRVRAWNIKGFGDASPVLSAVPSSKSQCKLTWQGF